MNKNKAEQQAEELIGMTFNVPDDLTSPMQFKLANELARQLQKSKTVGKIFWAGAAAVIIINAVAIGMHFSGNAEGPLNASAAGSAETVAEYYYADKLNSY